MNLSERDKKHLWHPLTQHKLYPDHLPIVRAKGSLLYDDEGKSYIDGIASWYTCMYGHCNEYIATKLKQQIDELDQVVFSGFTHKPAIELSEKLIDILPNNQQKIFFSDNGSTSVDVAIKMALHPRGCHCRMLGRHRFFSPVEGNPSLSPLSSPLITLPCPARRAP